MTFGVNPDTLVNVQRVGRFLDLRVWTDSLLGALTTGLSPTRRHGGGLAGASRRPVTLVLAYPQ